MNRWPTLLATLLLLTAAQADAASTMPGTGDVAGDVPAGLKEEDWRSIRAAHEKWRHSFMPVEGGWQAQNPGQQWTTRFDERGFLTTPRNGGWTWGLELRSYGTGLRQADLWREAVERTVTGQRLNYRWDGVVEEWWINDRRGLEHGFTIASRPPGEGENLWLVMATRGGLVPKLTPDAQGVQFENADGSAQLIYTGLKAWDAEGKALACRFEVADGSRVRVVVEDGTARYPVTIDPIAQQAYVKPGDPLGFAETGNWFGTAVALSGDTVVVGALIDGSSSTGINSTPDEAAPGSGAAFIFIRSGGIWTQQAYLKPAAVGTTQVGDSFGAQVAISGDTVVVGALYEDSGSLGINSTPNESSPGAGAVYVFVRSGTVWSQQAYLKPAAVGITQEEDYFGTSVSISGDTLIVGAQSENSGTTGINSAPDETADAAGAAYVFVRSGTTWTQQAYLKPAVVGTTQKGDFFGNSVAVSGDTVVVGAGGEDSSALGINGEANENAQNSGAVYIFVRKGTAWSQQAFIKPSAVGTTQVSDYFGGGGSVAISGDTVVVGVPLEDSGTTGINSSPNESSPDAGAVYVFARSGTVWSQQAFLKPAAVGTTQAGDGFGRGIAISGDTLAVGAAGEDSSTTGINSTPNESATNAGAVYVFVRSGATWTQQAYLKPTSAGSSQAGDVFGQDVAVSGDTLIAGAYLEDSRPAGVNSPLNEDAADSGAALVFVRSGSTWSQQSFLKPIGSTAPGRGQTGDLFGRAVAVSRDTVVVGAAGEDSSTTGINSIPNDGAPQAGAAYVFVRNGSAWVQQAYLKPAAIGTTQTDDSFGESVAIAGDTVAVGAPREDSSTRGINSSPNESGSTSGAAYVFVRSGTVWSQQAYLKPAKTGASQVGDSMGSSVALSGETLVVGARGEASSTVGINTSPNDNVSGAGAVYVFVRNGTAWTQQAYLKPAAVGTTQQFDGFGGSVSISGDTLIAGADSEASNTTGINSTPNESATRAGAAYVFIRSGTAWIQQAYLKPAAIGTTQQNDRFGYSVAVSGDTAVVGAPYEDSGTITINSTPNEDAKEAGAVYVFTRSGTAWSQQAYLKPADPAQQSSYFGSSVAVAGDTVVAGAPYESSSSTGIGSTPNENARFAGAAYLFARSGGVWTQRAYLKPAAVGTTQANDQFGTSVAISGGTVIVGAPNEGGSNTASNGTPNEHAPGSGAFYVFQDGGSGDSTYDTWLTTWFGSAAGSADAEPLADPNQNGIPNLLEYALGGDPLTGATGRDILPALTTADGRLGLSLRRYTDRTGITLNVETADSIAGPWTSIASSVNGGPFTGQAVIRETGSGVTRDVQVQSPEAFPAPFVLGKFLRLHVSP